MTRPRADGPHGAVSRREAGQSLVEFIIAAPVVLFFCFGLLQFALLFQAKATLDAATFEAAREGAVEHGNLGAMQAGLARGLAPLHARGANPVGAADARRAALQDVAANARIAVLNPTWRQIIDFGQTRADPVTGAMMTEIPNELLRYRKRELGKLSGANIQDANLLKIRVHYCYDMFVPFVNRVLYYAVNGLGMVARDGLSPIESDAAAQSEAGGSPTQDALCRRTQANGQTSGRWPIALESEVIVRMQSSYRGDPGGVIPAFAR
ncbi:TadE/TadG family type IV pilus assembly protein [Burkholderia cenocepacia]|jgi:hypothetical protein|uniref:TadE/TadG family type IV pilus assembly protein n=1 Tax=Burkholderia cenocepacia TaxID=95486 RepID=UPI00264D4ACB|nr:TadE family protein [Burkholderia cenocepacia]MDN7452303.1 pilus assembly protein [Burkholderia cenocepacia]